MIVSTHAFATLWNSSLLTMVLDSDDAGALFDWDMWVLSPILSIDPLQNILVPLTMIFLAVLHTWTRGRLQVP